MSNTITTKDANVDSLESTSAAVESLNINCVPTVEVGIEGDGEEVTPNEYLLEAGE